ncbi:2-phospho-L-lactate transferase [Novosphingobium pentaromativorans]|uniref:LPPG:FO 2-phospho-L-lactate transferase n=1 Tax=Novosphingobium pentaromativorans US6-1 TaxID=1088721 RepID=G6E807_9SPHN|nr:2-phospho-L-lactate transferase [Novosphingobium pentaromativorans]AIT81478.1 2-phospho-L-lactate transferase [Novosphingobium pentaromativorans US6-1]EHJ62650.1 LPPG:FO 2-phospho-L-lactate transferase [Novosphingobium pentaromativorans US6-1]
MKVVALTGGVGGAKLVLGLQQILPAPDLTAIVNTADDFRHLGLHVSPDIDTLLYTLSGKANREQGWGREGESWAFMEALRELGGEDWFQMGDMDLALHVLRTMRLAQGDTLSAITAEFARRWGVDVALLPMSDDPVATWLHTEEGKLEFQRYFVERRCEPDVSRIEFQGAARALPGPGVIEAIGRADVILIAPSNPYLSIDPILAVPGIRQALIDGTGPVVSVSPIIGGQAVKGPTSKLMAGLGVPVNNESIAAHYAGLIDALLVDSGDDLLASLPSMRTPTLMRTTEDRARVAEAALTLARGVAGK